ncbi:MAG: LmeA family phospholipid-binding protein [Actinomycetota bacterium]
MRKVLSFVVVAIVVLAVGADFFVKTLAERAVASELTSELELEEAPDVDIASFPFLVAFFRGRLDRMTITSSDVTAGALNLSEVVLTLEGTTFEPGEVVSGDVDRITIAGGAGEGVLEQVDLNQALQDEDVPARVRLSPGTVSLETDAGTVEGDLALDENGLTVSGRGGLSATFQLPSLGGRVSFEELEIDDGEAILTLDVAAGELRRPN